MNDTPAAPLGTSPPVGDIEVDRVRAALESRMLGGSSLASKIGRFVLIDRIGRGGMGVVYAAYDPQLDRKVAIKLLHDVDRPEIQHRLLREAQAMARLAHPHVITVFEIGEHDGRAFIAMELVEGQTLRAWASAAPRTQREILDVYLQAGSGLVAVHAADLVHRDFKPDNAMIGVDGRVRVMDFGLVRADLVAGEVSAPDGEIVGDDTRSPRTAHGARLGTPSYMAPEQILGQVTDARTDQFAFCVALWESLAGARPFVGADSKELFAAVLAHEIRSPARDKLPRWLETALRRGLAHDPDDRHPSMALLLRALADDPTRRRRRMLALAGAVTMVVVGAGAVRVAGQMRVAACDSLRDAIAWEQSDGDRIRQGLVATGVGYAGDTGERVTEALVGYATSLAAARASTCHAHEVDGTWSSTQAAAAAACLDEATNAMGELVELLASARSDDVEHAVESVEALPRVTDCVDTAELEHRRVAGTSPAGEALRRALGTARMHGRSGRYRDALQLAMAATEKALEIEDDALHATAAGLVGSSLSRLGESTAAQAELEKAFQLAIASDEHKTAFQSARLLAYLTGYIEARPSHAAGWVAAARAALRLSGRDEPAWRAELEDTEGLIAIRDGDPGRAEGLIASALTTMQEFYGPNHRMVAGLWNDLGEAQFAAGAFERALDSYGRSMATFERVVGPGHPDVARAASGLGKVEGALGNHEIALQHFDRARRLRTNALGPEHPMVALTRHDIGNEYARHGDLDQARGHMLEALRVWQAANGDDAPEPALALFGLAHLELAAHDLPRALDYAEQAVAANERRGSGDSEQLVRCYGVLGLVAQEMQDPATAKAALQRALSVAERALGRDHARLAEVLNNLANSEHTLGEDEAARRHYSRALEIIERHGTTDAIDGSFPHTGLGMTNDALGDHAAAARHYEQALDIRRARLPADHPMIATSLGYLALHYDVTNDDGRSREYYRQATEMLEGRSEHDARLVRLVLDWAHMEMSAGEGEAAVILAERAMNLGERGRAAGWLDVATDGDIHYTLAQAIGRGHARATALALRALDLHATRGSAGDSSREHIRAWLRGP